MDSVLNNFNKLVSTVTSTVSQLSVVLPGNPVTREYDITAHIASGGPGLLWKIYSGCKKTTKQEASIFVFEKKLIDKWNRRDRDRMVDILKKGVQQLTKLRHPRILTVQHPLEESRESLAFATEPVLGSLANVLGNLENTPAHSPSLKEYVLDEVEIKYGLLQVAEGLCFIHKDAKLLHGNLCPESIILSEQGSWKIAGFDFSFGPLSEIKCSTVEFTVESHWYSRPNLDYIAPEYETKPVHQSDLFSLGILTFAAFNKGETLFASGGNLQAYRHNLTKFQTLSEGRLRGVPPEIRYFVRSLLSTTPETRPDAHDFSKLGFLAEDEKVKTLSYLDSLFQWDNLQKSKFFKGLSELLEKLPHRVRLFRVVPCLTGELVNPTMIPFVLPNILKIGEWSTDKEFVRHILPHLRETMKIREPIQILFIFLKNMELLLQKTPPDIQKSDLLPLLYGALDTENSYIQVQELALGIIPSVAKLFDHAATKNQLLPRLRKLTLGTQILSIRVNCLICLGKILEEIEKWLVVDFVLPFLTEIPSREPPVLMAILGIMKIAANNRKLGLTKELIATKILPFLFPLTVENGLDMRQLDALVSFIHELMNQVVKEQKNKIEAIQANNVTPGGTDFRGIEDIFEQKPLPNGTNAPIPTPSKSHSSMSPLEDTKKIGIPSYRPPRDLTTTLMESQLNQIRNSTASTPQLRQSITSPTNYIAPTMANMSHQQFQFTQRPSDLNFQNKGVPMSTFASQNFPSFQQHPLPFPSTLGAPKEQGVKPLSVMEIDELLK